ncbi:MAG TPA: hypothetical protein EYG89_05860 [Bacteroidia bacterium]|nr:hypothetical protein [Bacteroidia bacterium]
MSDLLKEKGELQKKIVEAKETIKENLEKIKKQEKILNNDTNTASERRDSDSKIKKLSQENKDNKKIIINSLKKISIIIKKLRKE